MPPWISHINFALRKEANLSSRWIQLATIGTDNTPRVRTVVFRGWSDSYEMEIYTDIRSLKYNELELNNNVEICWLFLSTKCQFRLRGRSSIDFGVDTLHHWKRLSEKSKLMWTWPHPGEPFVLDKIHSSIDMKDLEKSDNFILIKINIDQVEQLILQKPIHLRKKWVKKKEWIEERINP